MTGYGYFKNNNKKKKILLLQANLKLAYSLIKYCRNLIFRKKFFLFIKMFANPSVLNI